MNTDNVKCIIPDGITQYGKGYFEWQAEGEGCTEINIVFTMNVNRKSKIDGSEKTTSAKTTFNHKVCVIDFDDPPFFVETPDNFVSYAERADSKYQYKVKIRDPELSSTLNYLCTVSTSGNSISGSLAYNDGSESVIEWTHNPSLGYSYSGKINCEVSQSSNAGKKYFIFSIRNLKKKKTIIFFIKF